MGIVYFDNFNPDKTGKSCVSDLLTSVIKDCMIHGNDLCISKGTYLIEKPVVIDETDKTRQYWITICGSGVSAWGKNLNAARFIGKGIPEKRGVFEFIGYANTMVTQIVLKNLAIECPIDSNEEGSCALILGDSWFSKIEKCYIAGYHGMLLKCGYKSNSYAMINTTFTQTYFLSLSEKGYAVADYDESQSPYDNVSFNMCLFLNTVRITSYTCRFTSCMWWNKLDQGRVEQYGAGLILKGGLALLEHCYFEDVLYGVICEPGLKGDYIYLNMTNCWLNGHSNQIKNPETKEHYSGHIGVWFKNFKNNNNELTGSNILGCMQCCHFDENFDIDVQDDNLLNLVMKHNVKASAFKIKRDNKIIPTGKIERSHLDNYSWKEPSHYTKSEVAVDFLKGSNFDLHGGNLICQSTAVEEFIIDRPCQINALRVTYNKEPVDTKTVAGILINGEETVYCNLTTEVAGQVECIRTNEMLCTIIKNMSQFSNRHLKAGDRISVKIYSVDMTDDLNKIISARVTLGY